MKKNLTEEYPDIFLRTNRPIDGVLESAKELEESKAKFNEARKKAVSWVVDKILETISNPTLKEILIQKTVSRSGSNITGVLIRDIVSSHLMDNIENAFVNARAASQCHLVLKFSGVEELFEKRFFIPEINAELWFVPRPHDENCVILVVGEMSEVPV